MSEDYFAELRHDLYNPINQIIGFLGIDRGRFC